MFLYVNLNDIVFAISVPLTIDDLAKLKTNEDVIDFLERINLSDYSESFKKAKVEGFSLLKAEEDDLEDLGVETCIHQVQIMGLFQRELKGGNTKYSRDILMEFLRQKELEKYDSILEGHKIDGDMLLDVNPKVMKKALKEMGMRAFEATKVIYDFKTYVEQKNKT